VHGPWSGLGLLTPERPPPGHSGDPAPGQTRRRTGPPLRSARHPRGAAPRRPGHDRTIRRANRHLARPRARATNDLPRVLVETCTTSPSSRGFSVRQQHPPAQTRPATGSSKPRGPGAPRIKATLAGKHGRVPPRADRVGCATGASRRWRWRPPLSPPRPSAYSRPTVGSLIKKRRKRMRKKKHKKMLKATRWQRRAGK